MTDITAPPPLPPRPSLRPGWPDHEFCQEIVPIMIGSAVTGRKRCGARLGRKGCCIGHDRPDPIKAWWER